MPRKGKRKAVCRGLNIRIGAGADNLFKELSDYEKKVDSYLGFAAKSRNLISGYHTCLNSIKQKVETVNFIRRFIREYTNKLMKLSKRTEFQCIYGKSVELSKVTGNRGRGVFGITDKNFADNINGNR